MTASRLMRMITLLVLASGIALADICRYQWVYCIDCSRGSCLQSGQNSLSYYVEGGTVATFHCWTYGNFCSTTFACQEMNIMVQSWCQGTSYTNVGTICCYG